MQDQQAAPQDSDGSTTSAAIHKALTEEIEAFYIWPSTNRLAYLALTKKPEDVLRDELAWRLSMRLGPSIHVAREWLRRFDLAILRGDEATALLEAKSFYAFDCLIDSNRKNFVSRVQGDIAKMQQLDGEAAHYVLTTCTNIHGDIPRHLSANVVKYSSGIRRAQT